MADINFDLATLFEQSFGYRTSAFEPKPDAVPSKNSVDPAVSLRKEYGDQGAKYWGLDANGREYYLPVTMGYADSVALPGNAPTFGTLGVSPAENAQAMQYWDLPYPVLSLSCNKKMVETDLTERLGTFKEYINQSDWEITIRGMCIGKRGEYPEADVTMLRNLWEKNWALTIINVKTDIVLKRPARSSSTDVVLKSLSLPDMKGVPGVQPYELKLVSDVAFSLIDISK